MFVMILEWWIWGKMSEKYAKKMQNRKAPNNLMKRWRKWRCHVPEMLHGFETIHGTAHDGGFQSRKVAWPLHYSLYCSRWRISIHEGCTVVQANVALLWHCSRVMFINKIHHDHDDCSVIAVTLFTEKKIKWWKGPKMRELKASLRAFLENFC